MAAVGCLEKEIQFQKEAIEEQDVRQAKDRLPTKNIYLRLKTSFFPSKTSRPGNRLEYPPVIRTCPEPVRSPGIHASVASRMSLPSACCTVRPCAVPDDAMLRKPSCRYSGQRPLFYARETLALSPFPMTKRNRSPQAEDGDLPSAPEQKFYGERGPGGDAFSRAPSSPGKYPASSAKNYAPASASASPAASSEAGPARGASATERSGICHCPGRGAVSSAFSPT